MAFIDRIGFWGFAAILQALILPLLCSGCGAKTEDFSAIFEIGAGAKTLSAQIALTDAEKAQGLMFRKSLPENGAMFFIFEAPRRASFWMKNTEIPLDIAFVAEDGTIAQIAKMYPRNLDAVESESDKIAFCIETNIDWFSKNGVKVGDKIDIAGLAKAVKQRRGE